MNIMIEKSIESVEAYPSGRPQSLRSDSQDMKAKTLYKEQYPDEECIDLRLGSSLLKSLQRSIAIQYLFEMDEIMKSLIPDDVHKFLTEFFSQDISDNEWQVKIDDLRSPEQTDLITALV
ncbi:hypothetical protein C2G38_2201552 [Gigaspora rosea]|uniref:Uncharacterized protein n=1 Tax=Gigaspora rosea TaxID=44941 RepID=A0A397UR79_9GLOM|nr:hypothetical protein C2G38_2201552 [Gigaspora rosea]